MFVIAMTFNAQTAFSSEVTEKDPLEGLSHERLRSISTALDNIDAQAIEHAKSVIRKKQEQLGQLVDSLTSLDPDANSVVRGFSDGQYNDMYLASDLKEFLKSDMQIGNSNTVKKVKKDQLIKAFTCHDIKNWGEEIQDKQLASVRLEGYPDLSLGQYVNESYREAFTSTVKTHIQGKMDEFYAQVIGKNPAANTTTEII